MTPIGWTLAAVAILCAAVAANKWEQKLPSQPGGHNPPPLPPKLKHGCPGCGAPAISTQPCSYCGREN